MRSTRLASIAMLVAACLGAPALAAGADAPMLKLAKASGCMGCHHTEAGGKGPDGLAAIGPAWREVAARYQGQAGAQDRLTQTVIGGSNAYDRHWKGKVSGLAMPANAIAIRPADARKLVGWILALDAPAKP